MSNRAYRVCFVTTGEAEYLNRNGKNELAQCCGHLDCFHTHGDRDDGSSWAACNILGCGCLTETPPSTLDVIIRKQDKAIDREKRRAQNAMWFLFGMFVVGIGALVEALLR